MNKRLPEIGQVTIERIDGLNIRLSRGGRADGIPILLTSPWPQSIYAFRGVLSQIESLGPVIAVDLPGFGLSQSRPDLMSPAAMGDFIIHLSHHLGIKRMHAVGPDVGTLALLFAAARNPELFESIIGGAAATSVELAGSELKDLINSPAGSLAAVEGGDIAVGFVKQSAVLSTPDAVIEDYRQASAGPRFDRATDYVRAYLRDLPILKTLLPRIETPVLVLAGKSDPIATPANGELLANHLPHCRHTLIDGGHLVWEDQAGKYGEHLFKWIGGGYQQI